MRDECWVLRVWCSYFAGFLQVFLEFAMFYWCAKGHASMALTNTWAQAGQTGQTTTCRMLPYALWEQQQRLLVFGGGLLEGCRPPEVVALLAVQHGRLPRAGPRPRIQALLNLLGAFGPVLRGGRPGAKDVGLSDSRWRRLLLAAVR
jgi:hypothetical protein